MLYRDSRAGQADVAAAIVAAYDGHADMKGLE
jgi:hypothetical protein